MSWHRRARRCVTWLALCGLLFAALAPSVSSVIEAASGRIWVEVCSAGGVKRVALGSREPQPADHPGSGMHCPYCLTQSQLPALPGVSTLVLLNVGEASEPPLPGDPTQPLRTRPVWPAALGRAPPRHA